VIDKELNEVPHMGRPLLLELKGAVQNRLEQVESIAGIVKLR
jgi:hypothetical protein